MKKVLPFLFALVLPIFVYADGAIGALHLFVAIIFAPVQLIAILVGIAYFRKGGWGRLLTCFIISAISFLFALDPGFESIYNTFLLLPLIILCIFLLRKLISNVGNISWYPLLSIATSMTLLNLYVLLADPRRLKHVALLEYPVLAFFCFLFVKNKLQLNEETSRTALFKKVNLIPLLSYPCLELFIWIDGRSMWSDLSENLLPILGMVTLLLVVSNLAAWLAIWRYKF